MDARKQTDKTRRCACFIIGKEGLFMIFSDIPRVRLLTQETPLMPARRYGQAIGCRDLWLKREDVMELGLGGNKIRSLEFWLGEALAQGCDTILAAGLPVSNLCRLTAAACARLGLRCIVIHNAEEADQPARKTGNALLNELMGVEPVYCGKVDENARAAFAVQLACKLRGQGKKPYIIGDGCLGALGYVASVLELLQQADRLSLPLRHIFLSASAGPTEAGVVYGLCLTGGKQKLHLISVEYERSVFLPIIEALFEDLCQKLRCRPALSPRDVLEFHGDYLGAGYARPTAAAETERLRMAQTEGIFLDSTYNAKVYAGLRDLIARGELPAHETICAYHTGGIPSVF